MLRVLLGRFAWISRAIHRAEGPVTGDAALEFFARLLRDRFLEGIGAASRQDRARDAKGGGEGFQVRTILKKVTGDK
jgi:hypothetical protein